MSSPAAIPSLEQLAAYRHDCECYEVAAALAAKWPQLTADAGFYVHPDRGPGDHGWNVTPDGTIVDMTATQHDYAGPDDEPDFEDEPLPAPTHPEIIPPGHPLHDRYVSWTRNSDTAQSIAHQRGYEHGGPDVCPLCRAA